MVELVVASLMMALTPLALGAAWRLAFGIADQIGRGLTRADDTEPWGSRAPSTTSSLRVAWR